MKNARSSDSTLVPPVETTPFHRMLASVLLVVIVATCLALVIVRHVTWDYPLDQWIVYTPIVLACSVLIWFGFFIVSSAKVTWRWWKRRIGPPNVDATSGFFYSIRLSLIGFAYTSVLLLFLFDVRFDFQHHLVQLIALLKLAGSHLLMVYIHANDLSLVFFHIAAAGVYTCLGAILYAMPYDRLFMAVDLLYANATIVFGFLLTMNEQHLASFSLLLISGSFWNAAFTDIRTLSTVLFTVGVGLGGISTGQFFSDTVTEMIALMFGSWRKLISDRDERDPLIEN